MRRVSRDLRIPPVDEARLARRAAARLRRARGALARPPLAAAAPGAAAVLTALARALRALPGPERRRLLCGPDLRGFLAEAETWIEVARLAPAAARRRRRGRPDGGITARLFDRVSRTEHLAVLLPAGRADRGFPARAGRLARRRLRAAIADLAALVLGLRLARPGGGALDLALEFRAEPEQGRPPGRIDLGTIAGPAGPLAIAAGRSRGRAPEGRDRPARRLRAVLEGRTLVLCEPGRRLTLLPAAGSPWRFAEEGARARVPAPAGGAPFALVRRETVPGTPIVIAPRLISRPRRLHVGRPVPGLGRRLARALRLVRLAWPEACAEILQRTWMVVPVVERGLVSYSLAARPGVSFLNVSRKSIVELADDLLHETAHHRLHDLEELRRLLAPGPATGEVQAFDSPWRGAPRPLHGLFHGAYTFLFRAELLRRLLRLARRRPRLLAGDLGRHGPAWLIREHARERAMLAAALRDLRRAARAGLLTAGGRRLLRSMRTWHGRAPSARRRRS